MASKPITIENLGIQICQDDSGHHYQALVLLVGGVRVKIDQAELDLSADRRALIDRRVSEVLQPELKGGRKLAT